VPSQVEKPTTLHGQPGQDAEQALEPRPPESRVLAPVMAPDTDVSFPPDKEDRSQALPMTTRPEQHVQTQDEINIHDHQLTDPGDEEAVLPPQTLRGSVEEIASPEESSSLPAPSMPVRVLRSRSISVQPPYNARSKPKRGKGSPAEETPALPQISRPSTPTSDNTIKPGTPNGQIDQMHTRKRGNKSSRRRKQPAVGLDHRPIRGRSRTLHPPASSAATTIEFEDGSVTEDDEVDDTIHESADHRGNTDDEEEVEIVLSQVQLVDTADEGSPIMEDGPVTAVGNVNEKHEAAFDIGHEPTADQPTADGQAELEDDDLFSSLQRTLTSPLPSPHTRAISVDFSPADKGLRGAATQAIMEERERALQIGRRALASREPHFSELSSTSSPLPPIFKGKARVRIPDNVDSDAGHGGIIREADHSVLVTRSPPRAGAWPAVGTSNNLRALHNVRLEGEDAPYRGAGHLPTSPPYRTSDVSYAFDEDSDRHFAGLDSIMARALRILCKRYRFSAMDVRQKFELRNQDLASTKKVLEQNRQMLDQDSAFQDFQD
jgi:hypothetical protein